MGSQRRYPNRIRTRTAMRVRKIDPRDEVRDLSSFMEAHEVAILGATPIVRFDLEKA